MPIDGLAEETSKLAIRTKDENNHNDAASNATSRLQQEARAFQPRGTRDVTKEFTAASNQLPAGQLVKDEFFTLFEAVGALEIMDPKMDSGYVAPDDTFEPEFDPTAPLTGPEVIGIMDELLCLEIAFLEGNPLSQTIYTSLHIDRLISPDQPNGAKPTLYRSGDIVPKEIEQDKMVHVVLRNYCQALIKCCQMYLDLIQGQYFYEEEDFVTHLFGRDLLPQVTLEYSTKLVTDLVQTLPKDVKMPTNVREAIKARLRFRKSCLATGSDPPSWVYVERELALIKESHHLGIPRPDAFSEKIQRQLATSTPPRPMLKVPFDLACNKWTTLINDMKATGELLPRDVINDSHALLRATWVFSDRTPGALARAQMQRYLFDSQAVAGIVHHFELLIADIRQLVLAEDPLVDPESFQIELPSDPRHKCSRLMEGFMDKAIEPYLDTYRFICQNRCRIRRNFTKHIKTLDAVQVEAAKVDAELQNHISSVRVITREEGMLIDIDSLTTWAKLHKLQVMVWTVQLGFETDIYQEDEFRRMYWFLADLNRHRQSLFTQIELLYHQRIRAAQRAGALEMAEQINQSWCFIKSLAASSEITKSIACALSQLCFVLEATGLITPPPRDFASLLSFYEARMKPFLNMNNEIMLSYENLEAATTPDFSIPATCEAIKDGISLAKIRLHNLKDIPAEDGRYIGTEDEFKRDIKSMETICVAINVLVSQLQKAIQTHGTNLAPHKICKWEKKYHHWWLVPQLKDRPK